MQVYLVGGAVRDELLGRSVTERDWVVVGATPEAMIERGFRPVGREFPVFIEPETGEEYALARTERKTAPGHQGFAFHAAPDVTLEQDLVRRDLTVNAMARTPEGDIIDPHGGRADLEARVLRHVSPAFVEDPLRVLRVARFAARYHGLGFRIADETLELMRTLARSGELDALTPERVWQELIRALGGADPRVFFDVLRDAEALPPLLPQLAELPADHAAFRVLSSLDAGQQECALLRWIAMVTAAARDQQRLPVAGDAPDASAAGKVAVAICERLRTSRDHRDGALALARGFAPLSVPDGLAAQDLLRAAEVVDAARRPERLDLLALAASALLGVLGASADRRQRSEAVLAALPAALRVDVSEHAEGLDGAAIGDMVRARRLAAVEDLLQQGVGHG